MATRVRFLRPYRPNLGPHYRLGEDAAFPDDVARDLIARGDAMPSPPPPKPDKAVERPPVDRQITRPGKTK